MNLQAGLLLRQQEFDPNNTAARSYNDKPQPAVTTIIEKRSQKTCFKFLSFRQHISLYAWLFKFYFTRLN